MIKYGIREDLINTPGAAALLRLNNGKVEVIHGDKWSSDCVVKPHEFLEVDFDRLDKYFKKATKREKLMLQNAKKEVFYRKLLNE